VLKGTNIPNGLKIYQKDKICIPKGLNIPNGFKIQQKALKDTKWL
jgi:hypothetical protein